MKKGSQQKGLHGFVTEASSRERNRVLTDAARRANKDQQALVKEVAMKARP